MTTDEIKKIVKKYNIQINPANDTQLKIVYGDQMVADGAHDKIRSAKMEILDYLKEIALKNETERKIKERKIAGIEGLDELRSAIAAWKTYHIEFEKSFESEFVVFPQKPKVNLIEVEKMYPRAAAYIKAEGYWYASNYEKCAAGKRAMERIEDGEDFHQVISDMEEEWTQAALKHLWD